MGGGGDSSTTHEELLGGGRGRGGGEGGLVGGAAGVVALEAARHLRHSQTGALRGGGLEAAWVGFELLGAIGCESTAGRLIESLKFDSRAVKGQHHPNYGLKWYWLGIASVRLGTLLTSSLGEAI